MEGVDLNDAIEEVIALVRGELSKNRVSVPTQFAEGLSPVHGDRVQLQQVMLNLILNAIEAMASIDDGGRELVISTESSPAEGLLVAVGDSGPGVAPEDRERIFDSFYTTKATEWGLASRYVAPSSTPMEDDCGPTRISLAAPFSDSRCRRITKPRFSPPNNAPILDRGQRSRSSLYQRAA